MSLDDVDVTAYTPDEKVLISAPSFTSQWGVSVLECILTTLREKGRVHVEVVGGPSPHVPTLAQIVFRS